MSANQEMFRALVEVLEEAAVPYCILAGYDHMPEEIASDIDFMLDPECAVYLPELLQVVAARSGAHVVQCIRHETTAAYFALARLEDGGLSYLHPDSSGDYRRSGRLWIRSGPVLRRRCRHPGGFWVPAAADAFAYYLIKKVDKGALSEEQGVELSRRFGEDPAGCERALKRLFFASSARAVAMAARAGDWRSIAFTLPRLRGELQQRAEGEGWRQRARQAVADARRVLDRLLRPTGLSIAFLGADGSGKSTLIERVSGELRQNFRQVRYRHLRPGVLVPGGGKGASGPVTDPHARPPRGASGSLAKLLHFWADYVVGGALWLYPLRVRSTLVIFDRYYHDLLADPLRYRYGGPLAPARWLGRFVPYPDISFVLDAPTEVLQARKQEVPWDECERQRHAYVATAAGLPGACVIDASRPVDEVVARVLEQVVAHMEARTARRLALHG
jgi:thymidylate kinase